MAVAGTNGLVVWLELSLNTNTIWLGGKDTEGVGDNLTFLYFELQ